MIWLLPLSTSNFRRTVELGKELDTLTFRMGLPGSLHQCSKLQVLQHSNLLLHHRPATNNQVRFHTALLSPATEQSQMEASCAAPLLPSLLSPAPIRTARLTHAFCLVSFLPNSGFRQHRHQRSDPAAILPKRAAKPKAAKQRPAWYFCSCSRLEYSRAPVEPHIIVSQTDDISGLSTRSASFTVPMVVPLQAFAIRFIPSLASSTSDRAHPHRAQHGAARGLTR
jgi:hypothetical protein